MNDNSGSSNIDRFGYTGQLWMKEVGLFHYKACMYSPKLGRFLQTDPIFYEDQMNMHAYVGNDPVKMKDSRGMNRELNDRCTGEFRYFCSSVGDNKTRIIQHEEQGALRSDGVYDFPLEDAPEACEAPCGDEYGNPISETLIQKSLS